MHERHTNRLRYFNEQIYTTEKYVIPFINEIKEVSADKKVLEIGCGEGGNLKPFLDLGCECTGVDLASNKIENAKNYFDSNSHKGKLTLVCENIYNIHNQDFTFDIIFLRDVIEHIHDQERFMNHVKNFLKPGGIIFFGFPPWQNPFGGHQQILESKLLSKIPFIHLLPRFMYVGLMRMFGESEIKITTMLEMVDTRLTIEHFNRILNKEGFKVDKVSYYLINPNYEIKFKLKVREVFGFISAIPFIRNFFITTCYYVVSLK
jgi:SAM-dependent methyltransferase